MEEEDEASEYSIPREITTMSQEDEDDGVLSSSAGSSSMHGGEKLVEDLLGKELVVRSVDVSDKNTAVKVAVNE